MAATAGGSVTWILDTDSSQFDKGLTTARGNIKQFGKELDATTTLASSNMKSMAAKAADGFGSVASSIGSILKPLSVLAITGSIGLGGLVKFGFNATREIQKTTAGIISLTGSSEEAGKVISQMIAYVQGKPFDRLEVIQASRQLLAMGRTTGQLTGDIDLLGKAVILTGGDFSSLAQIYGQAASSNRVMSGELNQLESSGIPITMKLGQAMGITAAEVRKMAENGQIDFATFRTALEMALPADIIKNASNTIDNQLKSLTASFRNLAFDILGVDFSKMDGKPLIIVGGLLDRVTNAIQEVIKKLRAPEMREVFKKFGDQIAGVVEQVLPKLIDGMIFLMTHLNEIITLVVAFAAAWVVFKTMSIAATIVQIGISIGSMIGLIASATSGLGLMAAAQQILNIAMTMNPVGVIIAGITLLIAALAFLQVKFNIFGKAWQWLQGMIKPLMPLFDSIGKFIKDQLVSAFDSLKSIWDQLVKSMQPLIDAFQVFWKQHGKMVVDILKWVGIAIAAIVLGPLVAGFMIFLGALKLVTMVLKFVADNFNIIKDVILAVIGFALAPFIFVIQLLIGTFNFLVAAITLVWNFMVAAFTAIWNFISPILNFIMNLFIIIFGSILLVIISFVKFVWNLWVTVFTAIWNFIVFIWNAVYNAVAGPLTAIWNFVTMALGIVWSIISGVFNRIWSFVSGVWNSIYNTVSGALNKVINFVSGLGNSLYDAGKNLIEGLWRGISDMAGKVFQKAQEIADGVKNKIKSALGIRSPSRVMISLGENVSKGFALGLEDGLKNIQASATQMSISAQAPVLGNNAFASPTNNTDIVNNINGNIMLGDASAVDTFFARLNRNGELAAKGMTTA